MNKKKVISIVKKVSVSIVSVFAVLMMIFTIISATTFNNPDRKIFGYQVLTVLSDSMKATDFESGDIIFIKEVKKPETLKEGDIICYESTNSDNFGEKVTHKIKRLTKDEKGPGFITFGTTTGVEDKEIVRYSQVIGKYQGRLPKVGYFFTFLKTPPGYILCIFLPFVVLIIIQGMNAVVLFKKYKKEQLANINAEHIRQKQELEEERQRLEMQQEESRKMLEELNKLKEQLSVEQNSKQNINQNLESQNETPKLDESKSSGQDLK